jgi:four helix bundle protein
MTDHTHNFTGRKGYGRFHYLDNAKFCSNARGSCWEVLDHLITANDEDFLKSELLDQGRSQVARSVKLLNGYMNYLKKAHEREP